MKGEYLCIQIVVNGPSYEAQQSLISNVKFKTQAVAILHKSGSVKTASMRNYTCCMPALQIYTFVQMRSSVYERCRFDYSPFSKALRHS